MVSLITGQTSHIDDRSAWGRCPKLETQNSHFSPKSLQNTLNNVKQPLKIKINLFYGSKLVIKKNLKKNNKNTFKNRYKLNKFTNLKCGGE